MMPHTETLPDRIEHLRAQALELLARVENDGLRARLQDALNELERIPSLFPERLAWHALLVPAGRIQTVRDIVATTDALRGEREAL